MKNARNQKSDSRKLQVEEGELSAGDVLDLFPEAPNVVELANLPTVGDVGIEKREYVSHGGKSNGTATGVRARIETWIKRQKEKLASGTAPK